MLIIDTNWYRYLLIVYWKLITKINKTSSVILANSWTTDVFLQDYLLNILCSIWSIVIVLIIIDVLVLNWWQYWTNCEHINSFNIPWKKEEKKNYQLLWISFYEYVVVKKNDESEFIVSNNNRLEMWNEIMIRIFSIGKKQPPEFPDNEELDVG